MFAVLSPRTFAVFAHLSEFHFADVSVAINAKIGATWWFRVAVAEPQDEPAIDGGNDTRPRTMIVLAVLLDEVLASATDCIHVLLRCAES